MQLLPFIKFSILKKRAIVALLVMFNVAILNYCWYQVVAKWFISILFSEFALCMMGEDLPEVSESEISAAAERPQWLVNYSQAVADDVTDCVRGLPGGVSEGTLRELVEAAVQDNYHAHSLRDPVLIRAHEDCAYRNILVETSRIQNEQIHRLESIIGNQERLIAELNGRVAEQHVLISQLSQSIRHK